MKVEQFTGVTEKTGLKIFKPISHIEIVGSGAAATNIFDGLVVTARVVNGQLGKDETIIPAIKLKYLAEVSTVFEGSYFTKADKSTFRACVDITEVGGLNLDNNKFLEVNLTGLIAGYTYTVYGIEANDKEGYVYRYSKLNCNTNQTLATFQNNGAELLVLPVTNLTEVNLMHSNGTSKRWTIEELKAVMDKANDIVKYDENGKAYCGYIECFVLQLDGIHTYEITTDGTAYEFYAVDTKSV